MHNQVNLQIPLQDAISDIINEVENCAAAYYLWKELNNQASDNSDITKALNQSALCWNTMKHSLTVAFIIGLGKLFDDDGQALSVNALLRMCIGNDEFTFEALLERKVKAVGVSHNRELLEAALSHYQGFDATPFIHELRGSTSKIKKDVFVKVYKPLRHKVIAHKSLEYAGRESELFQQTLIGEIEEMIFHLSYVKEALWQLYWNGRVIEKSEYHIRTPEDIVPNVATLYSLLVAGNKSK